MLIKEDLYWLAGLLEGEGSFTKPPPSKKNKIAIHLEMTDRDIVEKAARIMSASVYCPKRREKYKQSYRFNLSHAKAFYWMTLLFPLMGSRRQQRIKECLEEYNPIKYDYNLPSKEELIKLNETLSLRQIAKQFGCAHETIRRNMK